MNKLYATAVLLLLLVASGKPGLAQRVEGDSLKNEDVIQLTKLGLGKEVIIAKVRQAPSVEFDLGVAGLGALKKSGVHEDVIKSMLDRDTGMAVAPSPAGLSWPAGMRGPVSKSAPKLTTKNGMVPLRESPGRWTSTGFGAFTFFFLDVPGHSSNVQIRDRRPGILIQNDHSPENFFFLVKLDSNPEDNTRSVKMGSAKRAIKTIFKGGRPTFPDPDYTVAYEAKAEQAGTWRITPKGELPPGQYGVLDNGYFNGEVVAVFDFSVQ